LASAPRKFCIRENFGALGEFYLFGTATASRITLPAYSNLPSRQPAIITKQQRRFDMNTDQMKGKATQISGKLKETWGKLTDDDLALYEGQRDKFLGKVQENYGIAKETAEKRLSALEDSYRESERDAA